MFKLVLRARVSSRCFGRESAHGISRRLVRAQETWADHALAVRAPAVDSSAQAQDPPPAAICAADSLAECAEAALGGLPPPPASSVEAIGYGAAARAAGPGYLSGVRSGGQPWPIPLSSAHPFTPPADPASARRPPGPGLTGSPRPAARPGSRPLLHSDLAGTPLPATPAAAAVTTISAMAAGPAAAGPGRGAVDARVWPGAQQGEGESERRRESRGGVGGGVEEVIPSRVERVTCGREDHPKRSLHDIADCVPSPALQTFDLFCASGGCDSFRIVATVWLQILVRGSAAELSFVHKMLLVQFFD